YNIKALGQTLTGELLIGAGKELYLLDDETGIGSPLLHEPLKGEVQGFSKIRNHIYVSVFVDNNLSEKLPATQVAPEVFVINASNITALQNDTALVWFGASFSARDSILGPLRTWQVRSDGSLRSLQIYQYSESLPWRTYITNASLLNPDGSIWVAQNKGLYLWEGVPDFEHAAALDHDSRDLLRLADGRTLFATSRGIYLNQSPTSRELKMIHGGISATSLARDQEGRLWVGAQDGLYLFEEAADSFAVKARFVKSQIVNCLLFDENEQNLWIGTDQGLLRMQVDQATAASQRLATIEVTELITPDSIYLFPKQVEIASDNNYLSFQISGLEFDDPAALQIHYRLNGREWQELRTNELQFAAMADGHYQLELQASNDGLNWSETKTLNFEIEPPFWKSPWAYALISLLVIVIITFFSFRRIRNVKKREAEKRYLQKKLTELEQQALGAMMNPHFIFNTLNSIQHYFNQSDPAEANEYLARFAQLIRSNMEVVQKTQTLLDEELE
ncbi:MAG: histidine kinase, partial [Bacteroidota bacterium]